MSKISEALDKYESVLNESTNAMIGIEDKKGNIKYIYSHWDGYLKGVGETLKKYYKDSKKIQQLINLGSISTLGKEIGKKQDFNRPETQNDDWTLAYHRDRGEQLKIRKASSRDAMWYEEGGMANFLYVYSEMDNKWYWTKNGDWKIL